MPYASPLERHLAESLARTLQERRGAARLTQEQVAERMGISRQHYQLYESGIGNRRTRGPLNPTLATLVALARALETTVPDLIDEAFGREPRHSLRRDAP